MGDNKTHVRKSTRMILNAPVFAPSREMRAGYLARHKAELEQMLALARLEDWKPVMVVINHVRGTGAMYGFEHIGTAAEAVMKAVQGGEPNSLDILEEYARTVIETNL